MRKLRPAWLVVGASIAFVSFAGVASAATTRYAEFKPACKPAHKAGVMRCFALERVPVKAGTRGAHAYVVGDGSAVASTTGPSGGLSPSGMRTAYGLPSTGGTGQTVGIVDAYNDPDINTDLQTFDTEYGLSTCSIASGCLKVVNQSGATCTPSTDTSCAPNDTTGWSIEQSLDVDTVRGVCPGCKILLVEATSAANSNLAAAVNEAVKLGATEVSNSYGSPETGSNTSTLEAAYNHPGIPIEVSSGDDGFYDYDLLGADGDINEPNFPASLNTVVAVGGTTLHLNQTGGYSYETTWNNNGPKDYYELLTGESLDAEGGGCSTLYTAQSWQKSVSDWAGTACGTKRLDNDVSADADPISGYAIRDTYNYDGSGSAPGWATYGGTSLASPIIASVFALSGGGHGVSYPAMTLYGHLGTTALHDVTEGGNGWCDGFGASECNCNYGSGICASTNPNLAGWGWVDCDWNAAGTAAAGDLACEAAPGYDGPTGVGTPAGLTGFAATGPTATISGPTSIAHGTAGTWSATSVKDPFPGGSVSSYAWNWGDGKTTAASTSTSAAHTYATAGTYTITLTMKDNYGESGTKTLKVTVS